MPSTYTTNLGIELPADGELDGVWGDVVNENMDILDRAINGSIALSLSGTSSTLTTSDGTLSDGQYKLLVLGGTPSGTHTITIAPNDAQKIYFVRNTTAQSVVFTQGSGGNVTIATGDSAIIYSDGAGAGAAVVNITNDFAMSSVKITGGTIDGTVIGGTSAAAGTFTTANATTVDTTNIEVTTIKAKDGTSAGSIADTTGVVTLASSVLTTTDINGGTVDGAVIGGSSAAAGTFTTVTSGLGAVGTPSITFTGDTNTGMWSPAADTIAFSEGGAEAMRITSAGNVGIGTTTPGADLHVNNAAASQGRRGVRISASGWTGVYGELVLDTSAIKMDLNSSNGTYPLSFSIAGTERMRIDASGNVGIGTSSPATTLDVNGDVTITDKIIHSGDTNTAIRFPAADTVTVETSGTERMRIDSTGAVGIGTTTPAGLLEVFDVLTVPARNTTTIASKRGLSIYNNQSAGSVDTTLVYGNTAAAYLAIGNHNGTSYAERMRITPAGNVGIGTTAPDALLSVNGVASFGDGSAAAPSITNFGDLNTGMFFPAADTIAFAEGGTEVMRIDSSGNVGIGTASPAQRLHVKGVSGSPAIQVETSNATNNSTQPVLTVGTDTLTYQAQIALVREATSGLLGWSFLTNAVGSPTERMRIDSSGNVGIGTSAPSDYNASADNLVVGTTSGNNGITIASGSAAQGSLFFADGTTTAAEEAAGYLLYVHTDDSMRIGTANTERMRITSAGNVGIGTTAPNATLEVLRSSEGEYLRVGGSVATARSLTFTSSTAGASAGALHTINAASTEGVIALATASTERMRITVTGNVGIGTTSPIEKLDVRGAVFVGNVASGINYDGMILDYNTSTREARLAVGATSGGSSFFTFTTSNAGTEGERMRITSAGNVGIGTTSPGVPLDVIGDIRGGSSTVAGDYSVILRSGTTDSAIFRRYSSGGLTEIRNTNGAIQLASETSGIVFQTNNTERMRITTTGNVGIGNTTPITPLHVTGATVTTGVVYKNQPAQTVESAAATLTIAELLTGIIQYTGALATLTMPTGTAIEGGVPATFPTDMSFDFSVINTGAGVVTLGTAAGLTLTGGMTVAAAASGMFRVRKTALNTYTIYRIS